MVEVADEPITKLLVVVDSLTPEPLKNVKSGPADAKPSADPLKYSVPPILYSVFVVVD